MRKTIFSVFLAIFVTTIAYAQNLNPDYTISFKTMKVVPEKNAQGYLSSYAAVNERMFQSQFFKIIQFYAIPTQEERNMLKNAGIELLDYLPNFAYFAAMPADLSTNVLMNLRIRSIVNVEPDYKLDPVLYNANYPQHALVGNDKIRLTLIYYPNLVSTKVIESLTASGVEITGQDDFGKFVQVVAPISDINRIAALPFVVYLEPVAIEPVPENYTGRTLHHNNVVASDYLSGRHYNGSGVPVMLQDDGIIGPHIDYQGRIGAQFLTNNGGDHGDHCAGIIMAAGNLDPRAKGNAFGAELFVYSVSPNYPGFNAIPTVYNSLGIRVTSASYGDGCNGGYTSLTRKLDQQVRTYSALMHVFSAGNSGTENCGYGAGAGWGNITGGHKQGKNVIAVANLGYDDNLASSSSRGPAYDGRIKPDIGAKGTDVYSTINPNTYQSNSGTSMACPGIAGTLAQLFQAYRDLNNGSDPMAGLLKATILNTAEDLGNPGPDFKFGWGRVNALRAVQVLEEERFDSGVVSQGGSATHSITVPPNTAQVRVMVYWTDYEAAANASTALVNNLNIQLTDPASVSWLPWKLSHFPHPDSLNKIAVRGVDNLNNMEQVSIDNPAAGTYVLDIQGATVPQGPQTYYVVYEFIPETVVLTYPIGGESIVPGEFEIIRWDAFGTSESISLHFSKDSGQNWEPIVDNLPGTTRFYNWSVPSSITAQAMVKVTRGSSFSQSAEPFSIIGIPCNVAVDWACDGALHLSWSEVAGAASYEVSKLGEKYMDSVGTTTQTSMIVYDTNTLVSTWLSVKAIGADGAIGRRAMAIEKTPGNFNCNPVDAFMSSSPTAEWGQFQSCMTLNEVTVPVEIWNFGVQPIVNPILHFQLNNGPVVTETYTGTVQPDSTLQYTFLESIDISAIGSYTLKTWVEYAADQNPSNDSLVIPFEVVAGSTITINGVQNFDNWTKCLSVPICEAYSCALEDGWYNLANGIFDEHDWRTFSGGTPSSGTGPDFDHTTGNSTGKYLYIEPTLYCVNKMASVLTPCVDLTLAENPRLKLWYHAYGSDMGSFHVDLFSGSKVIMDIADPVEGNKGNIWQDLAIDLTPWAGKVVGLRFRAVSGCKEKGDFAIDDLSVTEVITSVNPLQAAGLKQVSIFPNPAHNEVTISFTEPDGQSYSLEIIDMYGRVVFEKEIVAGIYNTPEKINISGLMNGIYLLKLKSDDQAIQRKLVVR